MPFIGSGLSLTLVGLSSAVVLAAYAWWAPLLLAGAWLLLAKGWGPGVLCGAWGFETCHTYRSFFWRVEEIRQGTASDLTQNTAYVLGVLLAIVAASFAYSIWLCKPVR